MLEVLEALNLQRRVEFIVGSELLPNFRSNSSGLQTIVAAVRNKLTSFQDTWSCGCGAAAVLFDAPVRAARHLKTGKRQKGNENWKRWERTDNSYCCFPYNDICQRKFSKVQYKTEKHFRQDVAFT
jgi:hypothetical protein